MTEPLVKLPGSRHTRFGRPSGALVCFDGLSQDSPFASLRVHPGLLSMAPPGPNNCPRNRVLQEALISPGPNNRPRNRVSQEARHTGFFIMQSALLRSEERRVGKECR